MILTKKFGDLLDNGIDKFCAAFLLEPKSPIGLTKSEVMQIAIPPLCELTASQFFKIGDFIVTDNDVVLLQQAFAEASTPLPAEVKLGHVPNHALYQGWENGRHIFTLAEPLLP